MKFLVLSLVALIPVLGTANTSGAGRPNQVSPGHLESVIEIDPFEAEPIPNVHYETFSSFAPRAPRKITKKWFVSEPLHHKPMESSVMRVGHENYTPPGGQVEEAGRDWEFENYFPAEPSPRPSGGTSSVGNLASRKRNRPLEEIDPPNPTKFRRTMPIFAIVLETFPVHSSTDEDLEWKEGSD